MKIVTTLFAILGICSTGVFSSPDSYRYLGAFPLTKAAFLNTGIYNGKKTLYATSFGSSVPGSIDIVPDIASRFSNLPATRSERVATNLVWPNEANDIPTQVFGSDHIVSAGGFLVPGYRTGEIIVTDVKNKTTYKVSVDQNGYFYHVADWYDVDKDGLLDIVTAKTNYPFVGPGDGRLVWFKNPGTKVFPWKENLLFRGPDIFFRIKDLDGDGRDEVVASIFVNKKVSVFYNVGTFSNTNDWKEIIIDNAMGSPFDVRISDLNKDGRLDLVVTNHQSVVEESAVFAYEIPRDFPNGQFTRHVIATGFVTTQPGQGQASPGSAQAFYPVTNRTNEKPLIMVSGDGTQRAHLLRPVSENPTDWKYLMETVIFTNNTVGGICVDDVDNDGYSDVFIPSYDDGNVHVFTFAPF